jgi:hypothetical protein
MVCNDKWHSVVRVLFFILDDNISFLDTYTTCENGIMSTDIYNKPTDKHQYLSPQSCHPKHCTESILYSQALRMKRIWSNEQTTTNVDNIFLLAVGIAVYDEFFACMCAEVLCAFDVFAQKT